MDAWRAIEARIVALSRASELHTVFGITNDSYGRATYLHTQSVRTFDEIVRFDELYGGALSPSAKISLNEFLREQSPKIKNPDLSERQRITWHAIIVLSALAAEMSFIFADDQAVIRTRAEVAFAHLQRCIVVESEQRKKWADAFADGEVACEKLGSLHLLWHQLLAFKVHGDGARTDLVFPDQWDSSLAERVPGLVLTEWKVAASANQAIDRFREARVQADLYRKGVLAGVVLRNYRYLVVVTEKDVAAPGDFVEGDVVYRHICIAVNPDTPSVQSKKPR